MIFNSSKVREKPLLTSIHGCSIKLIPTTLDKITSKCVIEVKLPRKKLVQRYKILFSCFLLYICLLYMYICMHMITFLLSYFNIFLYFSNCTCITYFHILSHCIHLSYYIYHYVFIIIIYMYH